VFCEDLLESFEGDKAAGGRWAIDEILLAGEVDLVRIEHDSGEVAGKPRCWGGVGCL
jgi:hypothetical protein